MREVAFQVLRERPGLLEAQADVPAIRRITAPTLEELQHEAREALIEHYGPAHGVYRVRLSRRASRAGSSAGTASPRR
ncbi:MAG: hypothetical protein VKM34_11155 [Cyanobacteriota bacterium]|nr:hypothetical protein [Cyanobacteriota bacterium]